MTLMDVKDISQMLASRIDELVPTLLPAAERDGHEWRIGSCGGERGRSMAIHRSGMRAGVWCDFSDSNKAGDALDLVAAVQFGGDKKDAIEWARRWLGISNLKPEAMKQVRAQVRQRAQQVDAQAKKQAEQRSKYAQAIWLNASPRLCGSPVDRYLSDTRMIPLIDFPKPPGALRYAEKLQHKDMKTGVITEWPAMVAAVVDKEGHHIATHRTFLKVHDDGRVTKAPVDNPKLAIGRYFGGVIPLSRGASGKALKDAPTGDKVVLCEGIEDGLSIAAMTPEFRVLSTISIGNLQNVWLPPSIEEILIAADNDEADSKAADTLLNAIGKFQDEGRIVRVARSPVGKDFNDALKAERGLSVDNVRESGAR